MHGIMENDFMVSGHGIKPWHNLGAVVDGALTSEDALRLAKLDWRVISSPIYTEGAVTLAQSGVSARMTPSPIPGFMANVREDTNEVLGVVSDKYRIIQNVDAFKFADDLMALDELTDKAVYSTAGSLFNGRKVWMLIELPQERIFDDNIAAYLAVTNSHDGSSAMKVFNCATRIVCNNTLHVALNENRRSVSIRHMSTADMRKREACRVLKGHTSYFQALRNFAAEVVGIKVDAEKLLNKLFPIPDDATVRVKTSIAEEKSAIKSIFDGMNDLQNFRGSGWGFYNAVSDWYSHREPKRRTLTYADNRMNEYLEGVSILEQTKDLILAA